MRSAVVYSSLVLVSLVISGIALVGGTSHSPYAATWGLKFTVTTAGSCYDSSVLGQEQVGDGFSIDGDGAFSLWNAAQGTVSSSGAVSFASGPEWTGCPISGSGTCSSTSFCSGTMDLRNDRANWKFERSASSSPPTSGSAGPPTATSSSSASSSEPTPSTNPPSAPAYKAIIDYTFMGRQPCVNEKVTFTDVSSSQDQILDRDWVRDGYTDEFGSNLKSVSYTFWSPGAHTITLRVTYSDQSKYATTLDYNVIDCSSSTTAPAPTQTGPYSGDWEMYYTLFRAGTCYDSTVLGKEQYAGRFTVDGAGTFAFPGGMLSGKIDSAGVVGFGSTPDWTGCKLGGSGSCSSTTACSGSMNLNDDGANWRFVRLGGSSSTSNQAPDGRFNHEYQGQQPCVGVAYWYKDASYDPDGYIAYRTWDLNGEGTQSASFLYFAFQRTGPAFVALSVKDDRGAPGFYRIDVTVVDCGASPQPPAATSTASYPTASSDCERLQQERDGQLYEWKRVWYDYFSDDGRDRTKDEAFQQDMETRRANIEAEFTRMYNEHGCGYGGGSDCELKFERARAEVEDFRQRFERLRDDYFLRYKGAQQQFYSQPRSSEEVREFEAKWAAD
ncbi:MAG: PKD domain-containing protein, partial [Euryarchaeota archaeon]|nr:PKD domain-containing protein [Euryarchaeota archaeon]